MLALVVIVSYRTTELTIDCLKSIADEISTRQDIHVTVCENGTGDDSEQRLKNIVAEQGWEKWCSVTSIFPNQGFTGGNNAVINPAMKNASPPRYIILLNNDTIAKPDAFKHLITFMEKNPDAGVAGSRLEDPDGTPQPSAFRFSGIFSQFNDGIRLGIISKLLSRYIVAQPIPESCVTTDWVSGACMIIRKEVIDKIGPLDEGYYTYFDDIDYCLNASRYGYSIWYVPQSRVIHLGGQTTGIDASQSQGKRRPAYWYHARRRYWLKNYGPLYTALVDAAMILGLSIRRVRQWVDRRPDGSPAFMLRDFISNSVFLTGFKLRDVENPILQQHTTSQD